MKPPMPCSASLIATRDHARQRADWQPGSPRQACSDRSIFGTPKPPDHRNCGGHKCGCDCHRPTDAERKMWRAIADEIDEFLTPEPEQDGLFGEGA